MSTTRKPRPVITQDEPVEDATMAPPTARKVSRVKNVGTVTVPLVPLSYSENGSPQRDGETRVHSCVGTDGSKFLVAVIPLPKNLAVKSARDKEQPLRKQYTVCRQWLESDMELPKGSPAMEVKAGTYVETAGEQLFVDARVTTGNLIDDPKVRQPKTQRVEVTW